MDERHKMNGTQTPKFS